MGYLAETITGPGRITEGSRDLGHVGYFIEITPDIPDHPIITGTLRSTPRGDVVNAARGRGLFWPDASRMAARGRRLPAPH
jgi:hypothetical protein